MKCKVIVAFCGLWSVGVINCHEGVSPVLQQCSTSPVMSKALDRWSCTDLGMQMTWLSKAVVGLNMYIRAGHLQD